MVFIYSSEPTLLRPGHFIPIELCVNCPIQNLAVLRGVRW